MLTLFWLLASFGGGIILACFFEWTLHRFVMHKIIKTPFGTLDYAFKAHAVVHHGTFKADTTYHLIDPVTQDKNLIPMAWWNAPVLLTILMIPTSLVAWTLGHWSVIVGALAAYMLYYGAYEYMHWCMHLPRPKRLRLIELSWFFYRLNGHHLLHHRYMGKNFNVVLPLADLCLGTLLLRSKIKFPQARGPTVPDVQPKLQRPIRSAFLRAE